MKMKSLRNFTLRTTAGHTLVFKKFKKEEDATVVPAFLVPLAMEKGCVPLDEEDLKQPEPEVMPDPTGLDRENKIKEALVAIRTKNAREDFTAAGKPKINVVKEVCGFSVSAKEIASVWQMILDEMHGD